MMEPRATPKERKPAKDRITFSSVLFHATSDFIQEKTTREKAWTEALAVGCHQFVDAVKKRLGVRATYRSIEMKALPVIAYLGAKKNIEEKKNIFGAGSPAASVGSRTHC